MLKKIFKYDAILIWKKVFPLYAASLILGVFGRVTDALTNELYQLENGFRFAQILSAFNVISILGVFLISAASVLLVFLSFFRSLFSDEGYLTMVLPVNTRTVLLSKTLSVYLWTVIGCGVCVLSYLIFFFDPEMRYGGYYTDPVLHVLEIMEVVSQAIAYVMIVIAALVAGSIVFKRRMIFGGAIFFVVLMSLFRFVSAPVTLLGVFFLEENIFVILLSLVISLGAAVGLFFLSDHMLEKYFNIE